VLDNVRVEFEGTLDVNDVDTASPVTAAAPAARNPDGIGDTITLGAFANGYYDIDTGTAFTPYFGGGLGVLRIDAEYGAFGLNDKDHVPAYQWMLGVSWNVTRQTALTLGYRYRAAIDDPEFGAPAGSIETEYVNHGPQLGLRYRF
jgi:opacity protein-like surface antigen